MILCLYSLAFAVCKILSFPKIHCHVAFCWMRNPHHRSWSIPEKREQSEIGHGYYSHFNSFCLNDLKMYKHLCHRRCQVSNYTCTCSWHSLHIQLLFRWRSRACYRNHMCIHIYIYKTIIAILIMYFYRLLLFPFVLPSNFRSNHCRVLVQCNE